MPLPAAAMVTSHPEWFFDKNGALYGTTLFGAIVNSECPIGCGTVFQSVPTGSGPWKLDTIHSFAGSPSDVDHSYAHDGRCLFLPIAAPALLSFIVLIFLLRRQTSINGSFDIGLTVLSRL